MTPRECRPPEETRKRTYCWVRSANGTLECLLWQGDEGWWLPGSVLPRAPEDLADWGWRFHSIAEPPHD